MDSQATLKRSVNLPLLTLYGLGTIIGAGIYVLVGEVAQLAGIFSPISFLIAAVIAGFTAFTYAELSSRYPKSAGEAFYAKQAFGQKWIAALLGWSVVLIGLVSAATMSIGFVGYFQTFVNLPSWFIIIFFVMVMTVVAAWGISESVWLAAVITIIEVSGLLFVIVISGDAIVKSEVTVVNLIPGTDGVVWTGILLGAFLSFYAYIGFEDMVNIAEEVKDPHRTLPLAILLAIAISTILYVIVAMVAVYVLPPEQLGQSRAPLKDIVQHSSDSGAVFISFISLIAVVNGALIQLIMASRVLYGMAQQNIAPKLFAYVHPKTRTPLWSTLIVSVVVLILALGFSLVALATVTSFITLVVFAIMHLSLIRVKHLEPNPEKASVYPVVLPVLGFVLTIALVFYQSYQLLR